jgi:hypothetical protein
MGAAEMGEIASMIDEVLRNEAATPAVAARSADLARRFPMP